MVAEIEGTRLNKERGYTFSDIGLHPKDTGDCSPQRARAMEVSQKVTRLEEQGDVIPVADSHQPAFAVTVLIGCQTRQDRRIAFVGKGPSEPCSAESDSRKFHCKLFVAVEARKKHGLSLGCRHRSSSGMSHV